MIKELFQQEYIYQNWIRTNIVIRINIKNKICIQMEIKHDQSKLWDATEVIIRGKFVALNAYISKQRIFKLIVFNVTITHKKENKSNWR